MKKLDNILSKKIVKYIMNFIMPIFIGELFSSIINMINNKDFTKNFGITLFVLITSVIIYVFFIYRYIEIDKIISEKLNESDKQNILLKKENNAYQRVLVILTSIFNSTAKEINNIANNINGKHQLGNWNYKISCNHICNSIYEVLCLLNGKDDYSVNIVIYDIKAKGKSKNIKMIAEKSKFETPSKSFEKTMYLCSNKDFYAVKLFNKNLSEPTILTTDNEVKENFVFSDENEHPNYTQYVGIPIHCDSNKMMSLLQICSFNDTYIGNNKEDIVDIINNYILPFTYFSLLNNKMEKLVINSVSIANKSEEN